MPKLVVRSAIGIAFAFLLILLTRFADDLQSHMHTQNLVGDAGVLLTASCLGYKFVGQKRVWVMTIAALLLRAMCDYFVLRSGLSAEGALTSAAFEGLRPALAVGTVELVLSRYVYDRSLSERPANEL